MSSVTSMETFYDDYELTKKVVKFLGVGSWTNGTTTEIETKLKSIKTSGRLDKNLLSALIVPKFVVNDYLLRAFAIQGRIEPVPIVFVGELSLCPDPSHGWYTVLQGSISVEMNETISLEPSSALFVAQGNFGHIKIKASSETKVLRFCFVDASNLPRLRKILMKEEMNEPQSQIFPQLSWLDKIDTGMEREVVPQLWSNLAQWPQIKKSRRGKKSLNTWQVENQWRWRVVAATIPELSPPKPVDAMHNGVILQVDCVYTAKSGDDSPLGIELDYNSTGLSSDTAPNEALNHVARFGDGALYGQEYFSLLKNDRNNVKNMTIPNLLPGHVYIFRTRIKYGDAYGPWSLWSDGIATRLRGAPRGMSPPHTIRPGVDASILQVQVDPPNIDGGDPIRGFLIRYRHVDTELMRSEWLSAGSFAVNSIITIHGLLPNHCQEELIKERHAYIFQAAAYNRLGLSEWSPPSEPIATACALHTLVHGRGAQRNFAHHHLHDENEKDPDLWAPARVFVTSAISLLHESHLSLHLGPIATVRDNKLQIWSHEFYGQPLRPPLYRCEAWFAHWSPPQISVAAEIIRAQPILANAPLQKELYHRVAIANRGDVPFVVKAKHAQRTGALALVIADDGRCGDSLDQYCVPGAERARGEGFAALDNPKQWSSIHIPIVLILKKDADEVFRLVDDSTYFSPASTTIDVSDEL
uniref:Fibronectin type-III domain-containing protein n=1 Tax=Aureoumbra lagunensis TaxID=44058 RepID=A0A7S3JZQ1_9STRA